MNLLIIALLPVIIITWYIYNKDKEKEPKSLLTKLFFGGFLSTIITLLISLVFYYLIPIFTNEYTLLSKLEIMFNIFIGVALIEECSKFIIVKKISYNSDHFDHIYDMVLYSSLVSLGFACFENILYVFDGGFSTGVLRAFTAIPGHVSDGVFMGYYLGLAKIAEVNNNRQLRNKNMFLSIFIPVMLHGFYDYCCALNSVIFMGLFVIFLIFIYVITIIKIKNVSMVKDNFRNRINKVVKYCPICGAKVESKYCPKCGNKNM